MAKKMIEVATVREANVVSAGSASPILGASHPNAGATADAAHYLFSFETERSVNAAELAVGAQKEVNRGTVTEAELAIGAIKGVILDLCGQYGAITISTSFGTFETRCAGSVGNAFSLPAEGSVYLDFTFSDAQRREFAKIEARVPAAEAAARLIRATQHNEGGGKSREKTLLVGRMFNLEGVNITYGGEGEGLSLWDAALAAKVCDVAVNTHQSRNLWYCTLPDAAITPGRYKLVLNTLSDGDSVIQLTLPVDVDGEPTPPEPEPIAQSGDGSVKVMAFTDGGQADEFTAGHPWQAEGEGLFNTPDASRGWSVDHASLAVPGLSGKVPAGFSPAADGKSAEVWVEGGGEGPWPTPGTHEGCRVELVLSGNADPSLSETLSLPITLVVE